MGQIDTTVCSRILLLQNALHAAPDEKRLAEIISAGIKAIPCVKGCAVCLEGKLAISSLSVDDLPTPCTLFKLDALWRCPGTCPYESKGYHYQALQTVSRGYGGIIIEIADRHEFETVKPYLSNTANIAALHIENQRNIRSQTELNRELEFRIQERTAELLRSEERYRAVVEDQTELIVRWKPDGACVFVNDAYCRWFGLSKEQCLGNSVWQLMSGEKRLVFQEKIVKQLTPQKPIQTGEHQELLHNGTYGWLEWTNRALFGERGEVVEILSVGRDITERKHAEKIKAELEDQLRNAQKMEAIGLLAGGVAHDFNNLLTVIIGYSEMMQESIPDSSPFQADIGEILTMGKRAADLTSQLLAFSRKQPLQLIIFDLNKRIQGLGKMLKRVLREDIDLTFSLQSSHAMIEADPVQIDQILINLVFNARDSMPTGGKLNITTADVELDKDISLVDPDLSAGSFIELVVDDNGEGMDSQSLERIFEPFFTSRNLGHGTGLGLSMIYGITKQHGGAVKVISEPGKGTTFRIYLPRAGKCESGFSELDANATLMGKGETILVVEDEKHVRFLAERLLSKLGYKVFTASSAEDALVFFDHHPEYIDLLLTDVILRGMNGKQLFDHLQMVSNGLRVVYMSGYADELITRHGVLEKGVHFLPKPFTIQSLAMKIREALLRGPELPVQQLT